MKKIKKIFAACMATLIAGATLGSMSALSSSAAILGDVNNDGKLDVSDVVTLNKFLAGEGVLSNYNVADTNANVRIPDIIGDSVKLETNIPKDM